MSESRIVVERIFRDNTNTVEYRVRVCSAHVVDRDIDEKVPTKYIAAYVVNLLREYVQSAILDEEVVVELEMYRSNRMHTCPMCGRKLECDAE